MQKSTLFHTYKDALCLLYHWGAVDWKQTGKYKNIQPLLYIFKKPILSGTRVSS